MKIIFASDISFKNMQTSKSFEKALKMMKEPSEEFKKYDFSMINLENMFGDRTKHKSMEKSGPLLLSEESCMDYINALNPTVVGIANNHTMDFLESALFNTMDLLSKEGYIIAGAGKNVEEAYKPAILTKDGVSCAIIAVCENEFGPATCNSPGSAGYNLSRLFHAIKKSKSEGHKVIVYFHGGNEFNPYPSPEKVQLYRLFVEFGASSVIAMHTHCPQGYEIYNGCPIVYSMGNFFFPYGDIKKLTSWYYGYMTVLDIEEDNITLDIVPYRFDNDGIFILKGAKKEEFIKYLNHIKEPISDFSKIEKLFDAWCVKTEYAERLNHGDKDFMTISPIEICDAKNVLCCEAHNELMKNLYNMIYDGKRLKEAKELSWIYEKLQNLERI